MCGLECDVCKQKLPSGDNTTPTICIFPCFHKYCERCKAQVLATARPQHGAESRVSCKLCNQHFLLNVLYDYSENQIEKIFCLHCNIKNKAPVEWRCKSCENRYLCAHCSQPHYHSGHELEPVMKPSIPLRSQCTSHSNVLATYLCSCQARLCDYCLNNHADGSTEHPHEQRIAYTKLAERARTELETIRRQSIRDTEKIESLKEKVATNKKQIGIQATQARTAVANEVVELVNAIIRRGNDIVTCIDSTEETKLKNCGQLEKEMQHWLDRLTKIESFTQSALFTTVQQDHPGMWSASMFSQSALFQVNKRRDLAKNTLEQFERSPIISYQSWSTKELYSAIRSFGLLNLDGEIKIPAQTTPQNAHMFSISNSFTQSNSNSNTSNTSLDTPTTQQQNKRPIPPTQNVPPIIRSTSNHSNASTSQQQQHAVNFSGSNNNIQQHPLQQQPQRISTPSAIIMTLSSPPPPNIQQIPTSIHHPVSQQHNIGPNPHHSEIHHISVSSPTPIIPQLLQQPLNVSGSRFVQQHPQQHPQQQPQQQQHPQQHPQRPPQLLPINCPLPVVGSPPISLPNTPLTPVMHGPPDQMQIMRQNMVLQQQQQQQHIGQQQLQQQQQQQQQQRSIQQQQPCLPHRQPPPPPQFRMQQITQNHAGPMPHQIQQQNICQNSQQPMFTQQQLQHQHPPPPHIIQQQQMQQHQHYMTAQRLHLQQQQLMLSQQYHPQVMSPPFQQQPPQQHIVNVLDSPHNQQLGNNNGGQEDRSLPPIISRIPNPRLNAAQQFVDSVISQNLSSVPSATDNHPPQHYPNSGVTPLEHLVEMTSASTMPQQTSRNFENLPAHISHKQSTSSAIPEIVDLLDDEDDEGRGEQNKNNSSCQELEASINRLITVPIANDIIINSEKIEKINDNLNLLQQQDSAIQQLQQQQNNNNSPHLLKALRQNKPQSVAADSTVSFAGNNSTESPSTVAPINTNSGTKRKPASINIDDGEQQKQKRLAKEIDNNKILNLNNNEEKRPVNISPPADLITTTTEENGEGGGGEDFDNNKEENKEQKLGKLKTLRKSETPNSLDLRVFSSPEEQNAEEVTTQQEKMNEKISINSKTGKISTNKPLPSNNNEEASCSSNKKSEGKNSENVGNNKTEESRNATSDDFWDDYCYVCSQGCDETTGSLGCCESCPRVFHSHCHVPRIKGYMEDLPDDWRCSVCVECEPLTVQTQEFGNREQLLCAKVFLACFEDNSQVELFVNQVPQTETDYHSVIKHPIWLQLIGERINFKSYTNVAKFLDDMNLLFQNFSTFNSPSVPLATKGKSVYTRYIQAVKKFMPFYQKQIWIYVSLYSTRFNSTQATTSSSLNLPMEEDNVEHNNRNRLIVKGTTVGRKRGGSKAKSQTPA